MSRRSLSGDNLLDSQEVQQHAPTIAQARTHEKKNQIILEN